MLPEPLLLNINELSNYIFSQNMNNLIKIRMAPINKKIKFRKSLVVEDKIYKIF